MESWRAREEGGDDDGDGDEFDSGQRRARNATRKHVEVCLRSSDTGRYLSMLGKC